MFNPKLTMLALAALPLMPMAAAAHHSAAAYDTSKTVTVQATIEEFDWGAPHSVGTFLVMQPDGTVTRLSAGGGTPSSFDSQGVHARDFKKGTKVTLAYHPLRRGGNAGLIATIIFPDGHKFNDDISGSIAAAPPAATPPK